MLVLTAKGWKDEFLAYHLHDEQIRVAVRLWQRVHAIDDAFVAYDRSHWRKVIDYVRNIGLTATVRKIYSRMAERDRNRKCVAIGWGEVLAVGPGCRSALAVGDTVGFVAPFHPKGVDELCLHHSLVRALVVPPEARGHVGSEEAAVGRTLRVGDAAIEGMDWERIAAWSEWSGRAIDAAFLAEVFTRALPAALAGSGQLELVRLAASTKASASLTRPAPRAATSAKRAVIFGMGQYAKTAIAPRMKRFVDIACWHEIDPTQVGPIAQWPYEVRTSIDACADEKYDVYFVAGFHHTHVPIALHAINSGADVVVEKPLATTFEQLTELLAALRGSERRYFAGFHKRYNPLNALLREDIAAVGTPISYRAIIYEIPLPKNHWYCWPTSRGRIVSNGCHWIDHFLFLNGFSEPTQIETRRLANGDVVITIDLQNGASCSLTITEQGSARLGVREIVWVTAGDRTATIVDDREYCAESSERLLRRARGHRYASSQRMYDEIGRRLLEGGPGDSLASIDVSTRTILKAEESLPPIIHE